MNYIVTKSIEVEAETPEEAVAKAKDGKTISLSVSIPRTPPQQYPGMIPPGPPLRP